MSVADVCCVSIDLKIVRCFGFGVCWLVLVVCCSLFEGCCLLCVVSCLLRLWLLVYCWRFVCGAFAVVCGACCLWRVVYWLWFAGCSCALFVVCCSISFVRRFAFC